MEIDRRIAEVAEALTPTERRIASVLSGDPTAAAFSTVAELADQAETSGPTVIRFANKLGFSGYSDLQNRARQALTEQLNTPTERIRQPADAHLRTEARSAVLAAMDSAFGEVDSGRIRALASRLAAAESNLWIVASETSSPVAHVLAANLRLIRPGVRHLAGSMAAIAARTADAGRGDVVMAIDFERYEQAVTVTAERLVDAGATVVAVTDGPLSPLAAMADDWIGVTVPAVGPFDSVLPTLAVIEVLTAEVAALLRTGAASRLEQIEDGWAAYGVFDRGLS